MLQAKLGDVECVPRAHDDAIWEGGNLPAKCPFGTFDGSGLSAADGRMHALSTRP